MIQDLILLFVMFFNVALGFIGGYYKGSCDQSRKAKAKFEQQYKDVFE